MPRFYFDIRGGNELVRDEEGIELPDFKSAQLEGERAHAIAMRDANEVGSDSVRSPVIEVRLNDKIIHSTRARIA